MAFPDFLIIGAQKAGTSWLCAKLREHPDLYLPPSEEVHFFDRPQNFKRGARWYASVFNQAPGQVLVGEKTPDYFWPAVAEEHLPKKAPHRIYELLPDAKLIVSLRDPVRRAVSAVRHHLGHGNLSPLKNLDDLLLEALEKKSEDPFGIVEMGHYDDHLESYYDHFDSEQILVLLFEEDIVDYPEQGLRKVHRFLDVPHSIPAGLNEKVNSRDVPLIESLAKYIHPKLLGIATRLRWAFPHSPTPPRPETLDALETHYRPHVRRLFDTVLDRDVPDSWRCNPSLNSHTGRLGKSKK
ncbi:hypothetical protein GGP80_003081 [Salinibacter ruber]|uniref:sulfotransferase family protein n=1 Tax=Salinibacter ruber TaxID=146919 RepID=UPI002168C3B5|nr:hypothetical protein [Salinibacter ruber]